MTTLKEDVRLIGTFNDASTVTPSDVNDIQKTKALYIGATGNITVIMAGGTQVTFTGLLGGTSYRLAVTRVLSTGTTATGIVALY